MSEITQCTTWTMPDANHWNGFCTNTFIKVYDGDTAKSNDCVICVVPVEPVAE